VEHDHVHSGHGAAAVSIGLSVAIARDYKWKGCETKLYDFLCLANERDE
jgi:deoxyxylulose-5-phosphate synthase